MIYWADDAPLDATFCLYPFLPGPPICLARKIVALPETQNTYSILHKTQNPDFQGWEQTILQALSSKAMKKVVLARKTTLELSKAPDPFEVVGFLQKRSMGATLFCAKLPDGSHLIGATPERLFMKRGDQIQVEALAGTRPLGKGDELLGSEKDLREFSFVEKHIEEKIAPFLSSPLTFSRPTIHTTSTLHHLKSIGKATLKSNVSETKLINALHPTPALLGTPSNVALSFLKDHEPFARGFYGGLVGWSKHDACDWRVVIRVCHLQEKTVHLFTGTGIVEGSNPVEEWNELNTKEALYAGLFH